jgi:hypothetical protein
MIRRLSDRPNGVEEGKGKMGKTRAALMGALLVSACSNGTVAESGSDTIVNLSDAVRPSDTMLGLYRSPAGGDQLELLANDNAVLTPYNRQPVPLKWSKLDEHRGMLDLSYAGKGMFCINGNIMRVSFANSAYETLTLNGAPPSAPANPYPCP